MKKIGRFFLRTTALCLAVACLSACAPEGGGDVALITDDGTSSGTLETILSNTPKEIEFSSGENFAINAKVTVPTDVKAAPKLTVKKREFTNDFLKETYFQNTTPTVQEFADDGGRFVSMETDNINATAASGFLSYTNNDYYMYDLPLIRLRSGILDTYNKFASLEPENLSFKSKDEAVKDVVDQLNQIDINVNSNPQVFTLTKEMLEKMQEEELKDPYNQDDVSTGRIKIKDTFLADDEVYYMVFNLNYHNVPVSRDIYLMNEDGGNLLIPSRVWVYYTKDGIVNMVAESIYEVIEENTEDTFISANTASNEIIEHYSNIISNTKVNVGDIRFEYVGAYKPGSEQEYYLIPSWHFTVGLQDNSSNNEQTGTTVANGNGSEEASDMAVEFYEHMYVNAVDGQIISQ